MIKRIFLSCLVVFSTVSSALFFGVSSVNAASSYDDTVRITQELTVKRGSFGSVDVSTSYTSLIQEYCATEYYNSFITTVQAQGEYSVFKFEHGGSESEFDQQKVFVVWSENGTGSLAFQTQFTTYKSLYHVPGSGISYKSAQIYMDSAGDVKVQCMNGTQSSFVSTNKPGLAAWDATIWLTTFNITYPSGYEGEIPPETNGPVPKVRPDFTYTVNSKDVTAKDYNQDLPTFTPDEGYTFDGYSVEWSLFKCTEFTEPGNSCVDGELVDHQIQPQDQQYNYSVDSFADYTLSAQYLVQQCYRYLSYPATPDNCFYVDLETEMPDYEFTSTTVHLPIDGSTISGDTKEAECDSSGFCVPPSPYEDCTTYGLDVGGYIGCVVRNFQVWLVLTIKALFIPSAAFMQGYFTDFKDFLMQKFGFLIWPLTFAYDFLSAFFDGLTGTNNICGWSFGNLFNRDFKLNFCSLEQNFPSAFNTARYMIQAFTVFVLISGLYSHYRRTIRT